MSPLSVIVEGEARPQGALVSGLRKDGRRYLRNRGGTALTKWRDSIADAVRPLVDRLTTDPVAVSATFYVRRPAGHFGTGRNASTLRSSAPAFPTKRSSGDLDKLARAVLDALTGVVYRDDSQVIDLRLRKRYADAGPVRLELDLSPIAELDALYEREVDRAA